MDRANVVMGWSVVGEGEDLRTKGALMSDHPNIYRQRNITGQEPYTDPNACIFLIEAEPAVMDAIDADDNYVILWREEIPEDDIA